MLFKYAIVLIFTLNFNHNFSDLFPSTQAKLAEVGVYIQAYQLNSHALLDGVETVFGRFGEAKDMYNALMTMAKKNVQYVMRHLKELF